MDRPTVKPRDWITIGHTPCVVCKIYDNGDIEVVHNPEKPANDDAFGMVRDGSLGRVLPATPTGTNA